MRSARPRTLRWLGAVVAVAGVLACVVILARPSPEAGPSDRDLIEEQVRGYVDDLSRGEFLRAAGRSCSASPAARGATSERIDDAEAAVPSTAIINEVTVTGASAVVDAVVVTLGTRIDLPMRLEKHNGVWCLADPEGQ